MRTIVCHMTSVHRHDDTRIFLKECKSLAQAKYEVHFVAPTAPEELVGGVQLHNVKSNYRKGRFFRFTNGIWNVYKKALAIDADIYHFHDSELLFVGLLLKIRKKKVIYDIHEDLPRQIMTKYWIPAVVRSAVAFGMEIIEERVVRFFDGVVTATPHIEERFKVLPISNVVNVNNYPMRNELTCDMIEQRSTKKSCGDVCYVGGITSIRGITEMIEALAKTNSRLLLAGEFSPSDLKYKMEQLPGWKQVEFYGFLGREKVKLVLHQASAGLVLFQPAPNHISSQPNKLFEYMAAGIPVIASDFPKWKEIVENNHCGICVDPSDTQAIANAINWVQNNPSAAEEMGRHGRQAVENIYNWETEQTKLIALYNILCCRKD